MAVIATESTHFSNVVKGIYKDNGLNFNFETVIVNDTAGTLVIGQIMGKVTATGKYKRAVETAVDGSKVADAVVAEVKTIAGSTDTQVLVLKRGPATLVKPNLTLDATYDNAAKKDAVYASLNALQFQLLDVAV